MNNLVSPEARQWNHLTDIHHIEPLGPQDQACLEAIREVLAKHECLERFGINLLHKHFEMAEDEILVEDVDEKTRTLVTRPVSIATMAADLETGIATQWHWQRNRDGAYEQICVARCFPGNWQSPGHSNQHTGW
jgi:hypothetical protein